MRAMGIFAAFFLLFTSASIAVPIPLFPGSMIPSLLGIPTSDYVPYLEAVINGLTYGFIIWIVFFMVDKRIDKSVSMDSEKITR